MEKGKQILIECVLFSAISTFHDIEDKQKRNQYAREYFIDFCKENDIDFQEAYDVLNKMFKERRENTVYKYERYKNGELKRILLGNTGKSKADSNASSGKEKGKKSQTDSDSHTDR